MTRGWTRCLVKVEVNVVIREVIDADATDDSFRYGDDALRVSHDEQARFRRASPR